MSTVKYVKFFTGISLCKFWCLFKNRSILNLSHVPIRLNFNFNTKICQFRAIIRNCQYFHLRKKGQFGRLSKICQIPCVNFDISVEYDCAKDANFSSFCRAIQNQSIFGRWDVFSPRCCQIGHCFRENTIWISWITYWLF